MLRVSREISTFFLLSFFHFDAEIISIILRRRSRMIVFADLPFYTNAAYGHAEMAVPLTDSPWAKASR